MGPLVARIEALLRSLSHQKGTELYRWLVNLRAVLIDASLQHPACLSLDDAGSGFHPAGPEIPAGC